MALFGAQNSSAFMLNTVAFILQSVSKQALLLRTVRVQINCPHAAWSLARYQLLAGNVTLTKNKKFIQAAALIAPLSMLSPS
jgi:hypothetical protein